MRAMIGQTCTRPVSRISLDVSFYRDVVCLLRRDYSNEKTGTVAVDSARPSIASMHDYDERKMRGIHFLPGRTPGSSFHAREPLKGGRALFIARGTPYTAHRAVVGLRATNASLRPHGRRRMLVSCSTGHTTACPRGGSCCGGSAHE